MFAEILAVPLEAFATTSYTSKAAVHWCSIWCSILTGYSEKNFAEFTEKGLRWSSFEGFLTFVGVFCEFTEISRRMFL